jgi:hypothetical protein
VDEPIATPWVGNARELIGIPGLLGNRTLFIGLTERGGFEEMPKFLVLPAVTRTYHSLQNRYVVAHELAHVTENPNSHRDMLWREARADFMAYAITGETDLVFPEGIDVEQVRDDGSTYKRRMTRIRSLREPTVDSIERLHPRLGAYHHNSQITSSALFQLARRIGRERVIEFVRWMDRREGGEIIGDLEPIPGDAGADFKPRSGVEYVDPEDLNAVRAAIVGHLSEIGRLARRWSREGQLTEDEAAIVESVMKP